MSTPPIKDEDLILLYYSGALDDLTRQSVEERAKNDPKFGALFQLYKIESSDSLNFPTMPNIKFTPPDHKKPKPRYNVLIILILLLILVLAILFFL